MLTSKTLKSLIDEMMDSGHISKELIEVAARSGRIEKELNLLLHMIASSRGFNAQMGGKLNGVSRIDEVIDNTALELKQRYLFDHPKFIGKAHFEGSDNPKTSTYISEMEKDIRKLKKAGAGFGVLFIVENSGEYNCTYNGLQKKMQLQLENGETTVEELKEFYYNTPNMFGEVVEDGIIIVSSTMRIHYFISQY